MVLLGMFKDQAVFFHRVNRIAFIDCRCQRLDHFFQHTPQQFILFFVMPEEGHVSDVGAFGDVLDGYRFVAFFQYQRHKRVFQKLFGALNPSVNLVHCFPSKWTPVQYVTRPHKCWLTLLRNEI